MNRSVLAAPLVDGLGKTTGTPDVLRVVLGVTLRRPDVSAALADANVRQTRLRDALKRAGLAPADLQTSDVSGYPSYDNKGRPPRSSCPRPSTPSGPWRPPPARWRTSPSTRVARRSACR